MQKDKRQIFLRCLDMNVSLHCQRST